ncbi:dipeptide/oligopeptide/nickel ABC transporter permease/ATP-binding protein [Nesterenkonia muleiensis]|uniref:dipeptide/oligopeptide/nickel ABC transporter permease/ATP-binding protein n=1 Tax=Nesterenkonia muleiensis TaxID=2282648 RepID=UPI000E740390|nr:dipeptide/oligopeptide/nickel ABC transporter permease/ATP-binding protein [Nesterenkonia muleiensis]
MRLLTVLRTPMGVVASIILVLVLLTAIVAPLLWNDAAEARNTANLNSGPSAEHPLGTDVLGRDLLLRTLVATRLTVLLALGATGVALGLGILFGAAPVLLGHRAGRLAVSAVNIAVAFPGLLLALVLALILGVGELSAMWAIGIAGAPSFARLCQTLVASVAERDYIAAARLAGKSRFRILLRHVLPNIAEPLIVNATIAAGAALLAFAGLSFLGLGVQSPSYDWGRMMMEGLDRIYLNPIAALAPGVAVVIAGLAFNLMGEALARSLSTPRIPVAWGMRPRRPYPQKAEERGDGEPADHLAGPGHADSSEPAGPAAYPEAVLTLRDLRVSLPGHLGCLTPVRGISLRIAPGEAVGIVGESGSGKSLTALAAAQLVEEPLAVRAATLKFCGADLMLRPQSTRDRSRYQRLLGRSLAVVFQDPMTSFNPTMRIGAQLVEGMRFHDGVERSWAQARAVDRLGAVGIEEPERRAAMYPHEFSGGMRQRAMIAMGLMGDPQLIIADEPTTALDVTVQKQVLELLDEVRSASSVALMLISHDIAVVRQVCDRIAVMYGGRIVEELPADRLAEQAQHPYTRALIAAVPDMNTDLDEPLATIPGRPVDLSQRSAGCPFAPRCPLATQRCHEQDPALIPAGDSGGAHRVACWHPVVDAGRAALAEADRSAGEPASAEGSELS